LYTAHAIEPILGNYQDKTASTQYLTGHRHSNLDSITALCNLKKENLHVFRDGLRIFSKLENPD
jgi:hypothetical protein